MVTDAQVRKLMTEYEKHGQVEKAGLKADMSRNTAGKYLAAGKLPSEMRKPRTWRTREDPFVEHWPEIVSRLETAPELEAKAIFEDLCRRYPDSYEAGQLRTLQRRIKRWRAEHGPEREVFFAQEHRPGEAMQTDFTWAHRLGVTIAGEAFAHLLCFVVLPYSNWGWLTVCLSESLSALRRGIQAAVFRLGRTPEYNQTDNSTAATHDLRTGKRGFNAEYEALMRHLGMKPRTIQVGEKHQNGDVEALNGALKRRLEQHLLLRGSRDFESVEVYEQWLHELQDRANHLRRSRLREELEVMTAVSVERLREFSEVPAKVSSWSTINVKSRIYSVPSRLIGEKVVVRLWEQRVEVLYAGRVQMSAERLRGGSQHRIDYHHVIWSLVKKPGAFARYKYREEMFPTLTFRRAYDRLSQSLAPPEADREYLRVLHLAASTMQSQVEDALEELLARDEAPLFESVRSCVQAASRPPAAPALEPLIPQLEEYDALLGVTEAAS